MTIGIDISPLQGPHRMRGIGYTLINFINNVSAEDRKKHKFVFYAYTDDRIQDLLDLLNLNGLIYELRGLEQPRRISKILPGKLNLLIIILNQIYSFINARRGDSRIKDLSNLDIFLQPDQNVSLPAGRGFKRVLILYDIIPYVLEWDYMWSYTTARLHNFSRKAALRCAARRYMYAHKTKANCKRANVLLAISEHTKHDFAKYLGVKESKIKVTPLGVGKPSTSSTRPTHHYVATSWGYTRRPLQLSEKEKFLLYVGGADPRRKLEDLVTAFNHLRASGINLKLILSGDIMQGPNNVPTDPIRHALNDSSYLNDIVFLGFTSDEERNWLYRNASAFVFPSRYEGFGLPILEAMSYGTPVITYKNSSIPEVSGGAALYAYDYRDIAKLTEKLLQEPAMRREYTELSRIQAAKFSWRKTSRNILGIISS